MTAQEPDHAIVDGVEYALAGVAGTGLFDPAAVGLAPRPISTGCWRGYVCWYAVLDGRLVVSRLVLGPGTEREGRLLAMGDELLGRPLAESSRGACLEVAGAAHPVPFTGTLLLGRDFVASTYVHMGYHPAWKYATVLELAADGGVVGDVTDRSEEFAEIRRRIVEGESPDPDGPPGGPGWIARTFTLRPPRDGRRR